LKTVDSLIFKVIKNAYALKFDKTEDNNYRINILPEAFEDFFGDTNKEKKIQPEKVSHFDEFEIRADWGEALTLTFK